jgi:hypothetical protein
LLPIRPERVCLQALKLELVPEIWTEG